MPASQLEPYDWIVIRRAGRRRLVSGSPPMLISLEGLPGAGKSTQGALLRDRLVRDRRKVAYLSDLASLSTDPIGDTLIALFASSGDPFRRHGDLLTDSLLAAAIRANIVAAVLRPALKRHDVVIEDRGVHTMYAYSLATALRDYPDLGPGTVVSWLRALATLGGPEADVALWLRLEPSTAIRRASQRDSRSGSSCRYSGEQTSYLSYVDKSYRLLAAADPRLVPVDVDGLDPGASQEALLCELRGRLP
jgi:dTMP kinase